MTVTFLALWMLCALAAATFATVAAPRRQWLIALAVGFVSVFVFSDPARSPDPEVAGLFATAGAVIYLFRPRYAWFAMVLGGALAGMLVQVVGLIGAPLMLAGPLTITGVAAIAWMARRRPGFSPETLREEALLIVCTLGLAVAVRVTRLPGR